MQIIRPSDSQLAIHIGKKSLYHNGFAVISNVGYWDAIKTVEQALKNISIEFKRNESLPQYSGNKMMCWGLQGDPVIVRQGRTWEPILFLEPLVIGFEGFVRIHAEDEWLVFFSYIFKGKDLTPWRKRIVPALLRLSQGGTSDHIYSSGRKTPGP